MLAWRGGWIGPRGDDWQFVLGVGMACAVTALPILVLLMDKLAILRTSFGQRVLRYASLDDVAIWAVLALILLDWHRIGMQLTFLLLFFPAAWLFRRPLRALPAADRWYVALVWLALVAFAADHSGLHFMVGSFLAGVVIDRDWFDGKQLDGLRGHVLLVLMPVFFLSTGLRTSWSLGGLAVLGAAALLLLAEISPASWPAWPWPGACWAGPTAMPGASAGCRRPRH
ncbi:MAG: cation:proton antiporter [Metallibacterium sp.]